MKQKKLGTKLLAIFLLAVIMFGYLPSQAEASSSSEIKEQLDALNEEKEALEAQIAEIQSQYQANEDEISNLVGQKNVIDQEIALMVAQIDIINQEISAYNLLIADSQDQLEDAQSYLSQLNQKYKERIRAMEEEGNLSYWSVIFQSTSFQDLLDRINMIQEIASADQRRLAEMEAAAQVVLAAQAQLEAEKAELQVTRQELNDTEAELNEKREEADRILLRLIEKSEEYAQMMEDAEDLEQKLALEISAMEEEYEEAKYKEWLATSVPTYTKEPSKDIPNSSGWLTPLPSGSYRITSTFGMRLHPVLGYYRMHNGVDLAAPEGTPIYASKSGKVTVAKYSGSAGYYVALSHGDGWTSVYMHMTRFVVSVGQYVSQGQVLGYVGSTGYSTGNHLHFGIAYQGTYVNPMNYIK